MLGFFIGISVFGNFLFALLLSLVGSSIGSSLGLRFYNRNRRTHQGHQWFSGWGAGGIADGPVFMRTLFSMLGRLAAADGHVSPEEERIFRSVVVNQLRISDPASVASATEIFRQAALGNTPMGDYAREAAQTFHNRPQLLEMMLIIMVQVAVAEGKLHPEEDKLMREAAAIFGFPAGVYETAKARYGGFGSQSQGNSYQSHSQFHQSSSSSSLRGAFETLGVSEAASESEVRRAYRKKAAEYHPDKIAAKGLPGEFNEFATKKFQEIQEAWDAIRQAKGY